MDLWINNQNTSYESNTVSSVNKEGLLEYETVLLPIKIWLLWQHAPFIFLQRK